MSINEYEGILTSLEEIHKKLDRLLASMSNPIMGDGLPEDARFPATAESNLEITPIIVEKTIIKGGTTTPKEAIIWTERDGKKYKMCRYKCGNYVSWDDTAKKYLHYDAGFKLIGHDCPKYATGGG